MIVKEFEFAISIELFVLRSLGPKKVVYTKFLYVCRPMWLRIPTYIKTTSPILMKFGTFM